MEPRISAGLGKGFLLSLAIPIDLKLARISYSLTDGTPYTPVYGDLHHRDEDLGGLGDIRLQLGAYRMIEGTPLILGARIGLVFPTGKTEDNPFVTLEEGDEHQHLQFGGGTVDPTARVELILRGKRIGKRGPKIGLMGRFDGRFPLYENPQGYRGPIQLAAGLGPVLRLPPPVEKLQVMALASASWTSAERWDGEVGENSGLGTVGLGIGLSWNISPKLVLSGMLSLRLFEQAVGAQFNQPVGGTIGISGFFEAPPKKQTESPSSS